MWSLDPTALGLARAVITIQAPYTPSDERQLATAFCEEFKSQEPGLVLETAWGLIGDAESFSSAALAMYGPSSRQPSLETTIVALRLLGIHAFEHVIRTVWNNEGMAQEVRSLIKARVLELVENPAVAKMPPIPSRPGSRTAAVLASSTQAKPQAAGVHATLASHARIVASASVGLAVQLAVREWPQAWPELTHLMLSTSSELAVAAGGLTDALQQAEEQGAVSVDVAALFAQHFPGSIVTRVGSVCGIVTEIREKTSPNAGLGGGGGGSRGVGAGGGSASLFVPEQRRRDIHSGLMELKNVVFPGLVDAFSRLRAMQVPVERQLEQLRAAVAMGIGMTSPAAVSAAELCMGTLRSLTMRLLGAMLTLGELQTLTANADMGLLQQLWQGMACEETSDVCIDGIVDGLSHRPHDFGLASHIPQLIPVWRQLVLQMVVMTGTEVPIEVLLAIDGHDSLVGYGAGRGAGGQGQGGTQGGGGAGRGMGHMGSDPSSVSSMAGAGQGGYDPLAEFAWAAPANHAPESNLARVDRCLRLARVLLLTYPDVLSEWPLWLAWGAGSLPWASVLHIDPLSSPLIHYPLGASPSLPPSSPPLSPSSPRRPQGRSRGGGVHLRPRCHHPARPPLHLHWRRRILILRLLCQLRRAGIRVRRAGGRGGRRGSGGLRIRCARVRLARCGGCRADRVLPPPHHADAVALPRLLGRRLRGVGRCGGGRGERIADPPQRPHPRKPPAPAALGRRGALWRARAAGARRAGGCVRPL